MARRRSDPLARARQLQLRGRTFMAVGKPREAQQVLTTALRLLDGLPPGRDRVEVLNRVHITLANAEFELVGLAAARRRLDDVAASIAEHGLDELRISLQNQRGLIALRAGRLSEAVAEFGRATPFPASAPLNERCYVLLNRSNVHIDLGDLAAARRDLTECIRIAHEAELPLLERMATHNLGYVEFVAGNLTVAFGLMDAAIELDETASPAVMMQGKAEVLIEAGLHREADEVLAAAAEMFRRDRLARDVAEAELERARCALALGDAAKARRLAAAALRRFARRGDAKQRAAELVLLQASVAGGRTGGVADAAEQLRRSFADDGLGLQARAAGLIGVEALLRAGRTEEAMRALAELGPPRRDDPVTGRMHWHYVAARAEAAGGATAVAARRIRSALGELARYQASFGSIDLRTASAVHGRRLAELDIELALHSGRAASVYSAAERARAVSSRLPPIRPPGDPTTAGLLAELRQNVESLRAVEQDRAGYAPLLRRRRELERQILARSWTVSGSGAVGRPARLDAVRAAVQEQDTTMVMYVQAGDALVALQLGRRVAFCELGPAAPVLEHVRRVRADLDVAARPTLPGPIRTAVCASLARSLHALDAALLAPLQVEGPLVLVSTGVLGHLPWGSLPSLRGRPLAIAPSATSWLASASAPASRDAGVVALAGPDLGRGEEEVGAVGSAWPAAQVRAGATTAELVEAIGSAGVVHVAAHGVHHVENPLFSSVRMTDGPVFAHELEQHGRAAAHVVLSACEVGLATVRPGDEPLGLASVLLNLGTRSVIASVARVGDEVAERTMACYHRGLAGGADSAAALAAALIEVDADVVPPFVNFGAAWSTGGDLSSAGPLA